MGKPPKVFRVADLTFYECPPLWIKPETVILMDALHIFHNKNLPPIGGSWSDQPLWFVDAYKIYMHEFSMRPKPGTN